MPNFKITPTSKGISKEYMSKIGKIWQKYVNKYVKWCKFAKICQNALFILLLHCLVWYHSDTDTCFMQYYSYPRMINLGFISSALNNVFNINMPPIMLHMALITSSYILFAIKTLKHTQKVTPLHITHMLQNKSPWHQFSHPQTCTTSGFRILSD
jgi:hypothetical protein